MLLELTMFNRHTRETIERFLVDVLTGVGETDIPVFDLQVNERTIGMNLDRLCIQVGPNDLWIKRPFQVDNGGFHQIQHLALPALLATKVKRLVVRDALMDVLHRLYQEGKGASDIEDVSYTTRREDGHEVATLVRRPASIDAIASLIDDLLDRLDSPSTLMELSLDDFGGIKFFIRDQKTHIPRLERKAVYQFTTRSL